MRGWPCRQEMNGDLRVEITTQPGRTQVVNLTAARDGDQEPTVFIWSKAADMAAKNVPWGLLALNMKLTWGRVALRGGELIVLDDPRRLPESRAVRVLEVRGRNELRPFSPIHGGCPSRARSGSWRSVGAMNCAPTAPSTAVGPVGLPRTA